MEEIIINKSDEIVMKLLHYFVAEEGYSPIILHGAKDEIWLEKMDSNYQIVRIVSNYIHNTEQLDFDLYRTKQIAKKIKKKTFSFNMNVLSLFVNLGDNVNMENHNHIDNIDCANIKYLKDLKKYNFIIEEFPDITKETKFTEKGMDLFIKVTNDINKKNELENEKNEEIFKPKKPIVTYILIAINILIFVIANFDISIIYDLLLIKNKEIYRIITCAFAHYNIFHLLFNMYALYIVGQQIESFFGRYKYLLIYFGSIITSSLLSLTFMPDNGASLGASGAIFGLFGSLLYFGYHYRLYLGNVLRSQIIPLILFNLILGFMNSGIDNAAHIGGLIGGFLISMATGIKYKTKQEEKINGIIIYIIITVFLVYTAYFIK